MTKREFEEAMEQFFEEQNYGRKEKMTDEERADMLFTSLPFYYLSGYFSGRNISFSVLIYFFDDYRSNLLDLCAID